MLVLLAECESNGWFHFFKNKELSRNRISLKSTDNTHIIVMYLIQLCRKLKML